MNNGRSIANSPGTSLPELLRALERKRGNGASHKNGKNGGNVAPIPQPELVPREMLNLIVADHHPVVLAGVAALLAGESNIRIVGQARDGREAVEKFLALRPHIGLFEVRLPVMDGIAAVSAIREQLPAARLLMFTNSQSEEEVYRAVRAGAQGYVFKHSPVAELVQSIRSVASGQQWIPSLAAAQLARRIADRELTCREKEVLLVITAGKSNKEIGVALNISEATVKVHVTHILEKLKASGRTEAIRLAVQRGLVYLDAPPLAA